MTVTTLPRVAFSAISVLFLLTGVSPAHVGYGGDETGASSTEEVRERAVERIIDIGRNDSRVQDHLWTLSKEIGHRLTSSTNLDRAYAWTKAQFESFGLEARIEQYDEWAVGFDRGPASGRMVAPTAQDLTFVTRAWSEGTHGLQRGAVVLAPNTEEELEARKDELAGKWILRPVTSRENPTPRAVRNALNELVADRHVLGSIRRNGGRRENLLITSGSAPPSLDKRRKGVDITMLPSDYNAILERLERGESVELEFDIVNNFREGPIGLKNVIADLPGTEFPDEYVIVQGHLDSWDGAEGTGDNGTGVSTTLEAARILSKAGLRPRRTIRFVLYSGEEQGLFGSRGYVRLHEDELEKISIVLNHDNGTNYLRGIGGTQPMLEDFQNAFREVMDLDPERPFKIREVPGLGPGPSDHSPFIQAGVPGFHWDQDNEGYQFIHHTQNDTFENAKPDDQKHSAMVIALSAYNFANLDHLIDRTDMKAPQSRKMGVFLEGNKVGRVSGGKAEEAGWEAGDVILSIDDEEVKSQRDVVDALQKGGARKVFKLKRGEEIIETVLDYSDDPEEEVRQKYRERREARRKAEEAEAEKAGEAEAEKAGETTGG